MNLLTRADTQLFYWLFNKTARKNCTLVKWISKTGDGYLYLLLGLMLWMFEPRHGELFLYTAILAYVLELPIYVVLKQVFHRQRPCDCYGNFRAHISPSDKFSLPSGHTTAAFLMATLITHFYPGFGGAAYLWAATIGLSRILLGVHYPSDIVAGALLGLMMAIISLNILV